MKLSECRIGTLVKCINGAGNGRGIGWISGLTYNTGLELVMSESRKDREKRIIPLVTFPDKETAPVHHANLVEFTEDGRRI